MRAINRRPSHPRRGPSHFGYSSILEQSSATPSWTTGGRLHDGELMPRYYFHTSGPAGQRDEQGIDLADDRAAWEEAVHACGDLLNDTFRRFQPGEELGMEVEDRGRRICCLRLTTEGSMTTRSRMRNPRAR